MGGERTPQPKFNFFKNGRICRRNMDHGLNGLRWPPTAGQQCRRISVVWAPSGFGAKSLPWYGLDIRPINSGCESVYPVTTFRNGVLGQGKVGGVGFRYGFGARSPQKQTAGHNKREEKRSKPRRRPAD